MRKKRNEKRRQSEKDDKIPQIDTYKSNLHAIDEMQTFYIKNWDTEENPEKEKNNIHTSVQLQRKKLNKNFSQSLINQPAYSSSLPRLKPFVYSHESLKLIQKSKDSIHRGALNQTKCDHDKYNLRPKPIQKKTLFTSRVSLEHVSPLLQRKKIHQYSQTSRYVEKKSNRPLAYRKRTEGDTQMQMKFKEFKMGPKDNQIESILKKHKRSYKSQVAQHHRNAYESLTNISSNKIIPIQLQKISQSKLVSHSLKHYLSIRINERQNKRQNVNA